VVISMVNMTATPYAAAKLLEDGKPITNPIQHTIDNQFTGAI
jgi:hypothetical protein